MFDQPDVPAFHAMAMSAKAAALHAQGRPMLYLNVGLPSTPAPAGVLAAAVDALHGDTLGYTNAAGLPALRTRIAAHSADWYGVAPDRDRIMIVAGASAGFTLAFLAAFGPGARVGVVEPGYPCYRNTLLALGMVPVPIQVDETTRWAPTPDLIDPTLDGVVIASPSNPTGTVCDLGPIAAHCRAHGIRLISDEIYHGIVFEGSVSTAIAHDSEAIVINSFSKYFSMTGWRLGWMVVPDDLMGRVDRLQQNLYICASTLSQRAAIAAFDCHDELLGHVDRYAANRALLIDGLAAAGLHDTAAADGAFYVYADVSHATDDSMQLCERWLEELSVAATPGIDFDLANGHRFVRFSYAGDAGALTAACERIAAWRP